MNTTASGKSRGAEGLQSVLHAWLDGRMRLNARFRPGSWKWMHKKVKSECPLRLLPQRLSCTSSSPFPVLTHIPSPLNPPSPTPFPPPNPTTPPPYPYSAPPSIHLFTLPFTPRSTPHYALNPPHAFNPLYPLFPTPPHSVNPLSQLIFFHPPIHPTPPPIPPFPHHVHPAPPPHPPTPTPPPPPTYPILLSYLHSDLTFSQSHPEHLPPPLTNLPSRRLPPYSSIPRCCPTPPLPLITFHPASFPS